MKKLLLVFAITTSSSCLSAQSPSGTVAGSLRSEWQSLSGWIATAAEQMPEADYAFKPTASVRSFGQLIGHLAGAQDYICAAALGNSHPPAEDAIENKVTTKAGLVAAIRASNEHCAAAYAQADAALSGATQLFGNPSTRLGALIRNTVHDGEHYGNIVTYLRIKGMVPPSSQPRPQ
ncbi:MAG TPA: DinB family protein [Gemmatimonadaceae bacterium]|nr:DinB family protein [Gemmatimonadaceae bacterium]